MVGFKCLFSEEDLRQRELVLRGCVQVVRVLVISIEWTEGYLIDLRIRTLRCTGPGKEESTVNGSTSDRTG